MMQRRQVKGLGRPCEGECGCPNRAVHWIGGKPHCERHAQRITSRARLSHPAPPHLRRWRMRTEHDAS